MIQKYLFHFVGKKLNYAHLSLFLVLCISCLLSDGRETMTEVKTLFQGSCVSTRVIYPWVFTVQVLLQFCPKCNRLYQFTSVELSDLFEGIIGLSKNLHNLKKGRHQTCAHPLYIRTNIFNRKFYWVQIRSLGRYITPINISLPKPLGHTSGNRDE